METTFNQAFKKTIGHEGGYSSDPLDNGNWTGGKRNVGELKGTRYGISAGAYPHEDIQNLTLDRARELYYQDYWKRMHCDQLAPEIGIELFDTSVNAGTGRAAKIFQHALNLTNRNQRDYANILEDGGIGPSTLSAYRANKNIGRLFNVMNILQGAFYCGLMEQYEAYEKYVGWFDRIEIIKK